MRKYWQILSFSQKALLIIIMLLIANTVYINFKNIQLQNQIQKVIKEVQQEKKDSLKIVKKKIETIFKKK